jgi:hypothetical protein
MVGIPSHVTSTPHFQLATPTLSQRSGTHLYIRTRSARPSPLRSSPKTQKPKNQRNPMLHLRFPGGAGQRKVR